VKDKYTAVSSKVATTYIVVEEAAISIWKPFKMEMLEKSDVKFSNAFRQVSIEMGKADSVAVFCLYAVGILDFF